MDLLTLHSLVQLQSEAFADQIVLAVRVYCRRWDQKVAPYTLVDHKTDTIDSCPRDPIG